MKRTYRWLYIGIGLLALLGGFAWHQYRSGHWQMMWQLPQPLVQGKHAQHPANQFLQETFTTVDGQTINLKTYQGQWVVINFWATWCAPCKREIPTFNAFAVQHAKTIKVLGIALDNRTQVIDYLQTTPLQYPTWLGDYSLTEMMSHLGNSTGGLPFSLLLAPNQTIRAHHLGEMFSKDLNAWATIVAESTL